MVTVVVLNIVKALIIRAALALHAILGIWRVTVMYDDTMFWLLAIALLPLVIECLFTIFKRKGKEFKWFTPCFFFYLLVVVPCVWLLELDKSHKYQEGRLDELEQEDNSTSVLPDGLNLNPAMWNIVIEELLLYLLIISRWVLPRGEVTREQLSELLFAFIGIASDIMEMFSLFAEAVTRKNLYMNYWILTVWSVSVLQFCMTVTVTHQPKKAKNIKVILDMDEEHERKKMRNEIFAIILSMMMQDVPFVTLRLYTIITFNLVTYSLIFFTCKNILVILLLIYKIAVILQKRYCPGAEEAEDEGEEGVIVDQEGTLADLAFMANLQLMSSGSQPSLQGSDKHVMANGNGNSSELKRRYVKGPGSNAATNPPPYVGDAVSQKSQRSQVSLRDSRSIASGQSETGSGRNQPDANHNTAPSIGSASMTSDKQSPRTSTASDKQSPRTQASEISSLAGNEPLPEDTSPASPRNVSKLPKPGDPEFKPYVTVVKLG